MFPDKKPIYWRLGEWCWNKPRYIGVPLVLGIFALVWFDLIYLVYWAIKNWGKKEEDNDC